MLGLQGATHHSFRAITLGEGNNTNVVVQNCRVFVALIFGNNHRRVSLSSVYFIYADHARVIPTKNKRKNANAESITAPNYYHSTHETIH